MIDFNKLRLDFSMLNQKVHGKPLVYLDSAATAQKPDCVISAISNFYRNSYATVHRALYHSSVQATKEYEEVREKIRHFLNASSTEEIIFTKGTTGAINTVAYSFGKAFVKPGDEILISETEHHSNIVPWQMLCEERNAVLKVIPVDNHAVLDMQAFEKLLNKKTKLVAISHIANSTGTIHPIQEIISKAHAMNAKVLIDGAQSAPHMPIDVINFDADFFAFSGHKCYGPTGIGVLYGKRHLLEKMPPHYGGGDMIDTVTFSKTKYNTLPLKFEAGTPMIAEVIGLGAAINYIQSIGLSHIHQHEQDLLEYTTKKLLGISGVRLIGTAPDHGAIISFVIKGLHPLDIGTLLDLKGIAIRTGHQCAQPTMHRFGVSAVCRLSFGLYNNHQDVDIFIDSLKDILNKLSL